MCIGMLAPMYRNPERSAAPLTAGGPPTRSRSVVAAVIVVGVVGAVAVVASAREARRSRG